MQKFVIGQRWINTVESQLGLGTVLSTEHRTVNILFMASSETRTYAKQSAPLTRVQFTVGDTIRSHDGAELIVRSITEQEGLITYSGTDPKGVAGEIHESQLDNDVRLDRPADRLFSGQIDADKWLELRYQTNLRQNALLASELRGLTGCRTSLIPHQLYIAHEVARRFAPRILLADEVGLGKTIEAGLILHQQLITERADRVLIVVPESLVHQWLVEMIRRFNLFFSIFDEARCMAVCESTGHENPFFSEQLILCSLDFLTRYPERVRQAAGGKWDLLVVDEAHHLQWTAENASHEYRIIEQLSSQTRGLLLLTGTPEQLGKASHFASLRLLDPDRFHSLNAFLEEEKDYERVATAMHTLMDNHPLSPEELELLRKLLARDEDRFHFDLLGPDRSGTSEARQARHEMIDHLLDRHGTGRVLFRNTRTAVKGFPKRQVFPSPLPFPDEYQCILDSATRMNEPSTLCPEVLYREITSSTDPDWTEFDPRVSWLLNQTQTLRLRKILVITATAQSALELADYLKLRAGISAAVFHEHLSIVERDRAAAFFANLENGSPIMICSEIGSEGRNFQFSHDLILFDLPLNPDLLEQRIGRLDRIGQQHTINLHIPYLEGTAQEVQYRWYRVGLGAFEHTCPTGHSVFIHFQDRLLRALRDQSESANELIESTRIFHIEQNEKLHRGRDRLLEYNSCRPDAARQLTEKAQSEDEQSKLSEYMDCVFDCFGVDSEIHSSDCLILHPGGHMAEPFPCLPEDGVTITFDRATALANEDVQYITWDHPMVLGIIEQIQSSELGNTAFTAFKSHVVEPGTLLLECLYIVEAADSNQIKGCTYLAPTAVRIVIDQTGKEHGSSVTHDLIREYQQDVDIETASKIIASQQELIKRLIRNGENLARDRAKTIRVSAETAATQRLNTEIDRLEALRHVNLNVRQEEIDYFKQQLDTIREMIDSAPMRLDALRVMIVI